MKTFLLYACFGLGASATFLAGGAAWMRLRAASAIVAHRHALDERPPGWIASAAETVVVAATAPVGRLAPALRIPDASVTEGVGTYDPRDIAELRREGIDLASLAEIRAMMRAALSDPDPIRRLHLAADLKSRFGLEADTKLYARIERTRTVEVKVTWTSRGTSWLRDLTDRTSRAYDALLGL